MDDEQYLTEVQKALEHDTTRLGDVYRLVKKGKSLPEIRDKLKVRSIGAYSRAIEAIEKGKLPKGRTTAKSCRDRLQSFIKNHCNTLSLETIQELERRSEECNRWATDLQALEEEDNKVERETSQAVESGVAGIYVYTYPHYYRYPVVPETDDNDARTYLKVGMSEKDAFKRVIQQQTGMPESPMILQIWKVENGCDLREIERKIHDHLRTIGHGGLLRKEWFLTNEQSIVSTAKLLGLKLHFELNLEMDD